MHSRDSILLIVLLAVFVALAVAYSVAIPVGEGVDETPHFDYIRYVKDHRALPVQPLSRDDKVDVWMGHHPPLYYVLGALTISRVDTSDFHQVFCPNPHFVWRENVGRNGWNVMLHFGQGSFPWEGAVLAMHVVRLMTVGLGAVALYAIYRAIQLLIPNQPWAPLGAAALVGLNPSFLFMSSTVHHDTLQAAIFALAAWWALSLSSGSERWYDAWLGGLLIGGACLTKLSGLALIPVVGLTLVLKAWCSGSWSELFRQTLVIGTVALVVAGWWFARNQWLYGDLLGWQMFLQIHGHMIRKAPYTWNAFVDFLRQIARTYWGAFGYMHITFPHVTRYLWGVCGFSGLGLIAGLLQGHISKDRWREWLLVLAMLGALFASFIRFSIATIGAGHGRYLFPAGVTVGALLIAGLNGPGAWRHQRLISAVAVVGMTAYSIWLPIVHVVPKYAAPETAAPEQVSTARPTRATFGDTIRLLAYKTGTDLAVPGEWLHVELYWQAVGQPEERLTPLVSVQLRDDQNQVLASDTRWPVPSLSPDVWSEDLVYVTRTALQVPKASTAGQLHLSVAALSRDGEQTVPARGRDGQPAGSAFVEIETIPVIGAVTEVSPDSLPNPRDEVFASELALKGFEIPVEPVQPGSTVPVGLYWEVLRTPSSDYTVFIHVLDEAGQLVTQFDRPPGGGTAPTSTWEVGKTLYDTYPLPVPSTVPSGSLAVYIGMYSWPTLERLPATGDGVHVGDAVKLGTMQVEYQ